MSWHWIDFVILSIIGVSVLTGLFRGFIKELIALCIWAIAIWCAYHYGAQLAEWLKPYIQDPTLRKVAGFAGILVGILVLGSICNMIFGFIMRHSGLSGTDRLLGMGFGFVRGVFIVSLLLLVVQFSPLPYQTYAKQSQLYAKFDPCVQWLASFVPNILEKVKTLESASGITASSGYTQPPQAADSAPPVADVLKPV